MKKVFIYIILIASLIFAIQVNAWWCSYDGSNVESSLSKCLSDTKLVKAKNLTVEKGGFNKKIYAITKTIATILSLGAIFWIIYWSFLLVVAWWEEEKIKKWKDVIKWSIIGFVWVVVASSLITLLITFFYSINVTHK